MKNLICTRTATGLIVAIEGMDISVTGRDENDCFAGLLRHHAGALDIGITYTTGATVTPEHFAAVLRGEDRDAVFGPQPLRELLLRLAEEQPELELKSRLDGRDLTARDWAGEIREMDAVESAFLNRAKVKGARQLQIVVDKTAFYSEVTSTKTPGYEPPPAPRAAPRRTRRGRK